METSAEMTLREKGMKYVKQYVLITLSISIMSVGVYFFKFPNNFVFGGVTGTAALVAKLTPDVGLGLLLGGEPRAAGGGPHLSGQRVRHDHGLCDLCDVGGADGF